MKKVVCIHTWDGLGCALAGIKYILRPQRAHLGSLALIDDCGSVHSVIYSLLGSFLSFPAVLGCRAPAHRTDTRSRARDGCVFHRLHPPPEIINSTTHSSGVRTCALAWRQSRTPPRCQPLNGLLLDNPELQRSRRAQMGQLRPHAFTLMTSESTKWNQRHSHRFSPCQRTGKSQLHPDSTPRGSKPARSLPGLQKCFTCLNTVVPAAQERCYLKCKLSFGEEGKGGGMKP